MYEEIKPLQQTQLLILKELKRVCEKNNIEYFLTYGTLLGAVRHQGFIPWDDDIDVMMEYEQYQKLLQCKDQFEKPYFLQSSETDSEYTGCYMKLRNSDTTLIIDYQSSKDMNHGINIDIYPIYNLADGGLARKIQYIYSMLYMLAQIASAPQNYGKVMNLLGAVLIRTIAKNSRCDSFLRHVIKYQGKETKNKFLVIGSIKYMKHVYSSEIFKDTENMRFENEIYPVPKGYRDFLKETYGDSYMQLPPIEQQGVKLEHILKLDVEKTYKEYKGKFYCVDKNRGIQCTKTP